MDSSPSYSDNSEKNEKDADRSTTNSNLALKNQKLSEILVEYKDLLELQASERQDLLKQVDNLTHKAGSIDNLDNKIENLVGLLSDIREQISALSTTVPPDIKTKVDDTKQFRVPGVDQYINKPKVIATEEEVEGLEKDIQQAAENLDDEINALTNLVENKSDELRERDLHIEKLNDQLEGVSDEKERLASQLESLNSVIGSWQGQLSLLQKLAASDPRYKVIAALKKHGSLSDIQLAFTMGTSIGQIRKYIDDLKELELVRRDNTGRYVWIGKMAEDELNL
ncbi:MAG: hypothetical protein ACW99A_07060 [Candidatus Kariarchaeaceae archaeon]|jgi:chromosome segregation ATPase